MVTNNIIQQKFEEFKKAKIKSNKPQSGIQTKLNFDEPVSNSPVEPTVPVAPVEPEQELSPLDQFKRKKALETKPAQAPVFNDPIQSTTEILDEDDKKGLSQIKDGTFKNDTHEKLHLEVQRIRAKVARGENISPEEKEILLGRQLADEQQAKLIATGAGKDALSVISNISSVGNANVAPVESDGALDRQKEYFKEITDRESRSIGSLIDKVGKINNLEYPGVKQMAHPSFPTAVGMANKVASNFKEFGNIPEKVFLKDKFGNNTGVDITRTGNKLKLTFVVSLGNKGGATATPVSIYIPFVKKGKGEYVPDIQQMVDSFETFAQGIPEEVYDPKLGSKEYQSGMLKMHNIADNLVHNNMPVFTEGVDTAEKEQKIFERHKSKEAQKAERESAEEAKRNVKPPATVTLSDGTEMDNSAAIKQYNIRRLLKLKDMIRSGKTPTKDEAKEYEALKKLQESGEL